MGAADHVPLSPRRYLGLFTPAFGGGPSEPLSGRAAERTSPQHPSEAPVPLGDQWLLRNPSIFFFFFNIILFLYVCDGPWLLLRLFSSCGGQRPLHICSAQASPCSGFSCCGAWTLGRTDFRSCGTWAQWSQFPGSSAQAQ